MVTLASFIDRGGASVGVVQDDVVRPLPQVASILEFIELPVAERERVVDAAGPAVPADTVRLQAPIPVPRRNVFCVGWNYLAHFEEGSAQWGDMPVPEFPTFFTKATTTVVGPFDTVAAHAELTSQLDWEVELAVVIGKRGRDIQIEDASSHIFGYTVANDVSARDLQARHGKQWFKGKSLDESLPMGPHLITAESVEDPTHRDLTCRLNGEIVQSASTAQMIFPVDRVISELSAGMTLLAGDIILTGTPEGIGHRRTPPLYLQPGDVLESEIDGIGVMRNRVTDEQQTRE